MQTSINKLLLTIATAVFITASCGVEKKPHYQNKKNFGSDPISETSETEPQTELPEIPELPTQPTEPQVEPEAKGPKAEEAEDNQPEEETEIDPQTIILDFQFKGLMDVSSLKLYKNNGTTGRAGYPHPVIDAIATPVVKKLLSKQEVASINARLTFGENLRSSFYQEVFSPNDDRISANFFENGYDTGLQTLHKVVGKGDCPDIYVCVDKITYALDEHGTTTFCFYDTDTGASTSIPYSPSPVYDFQTYQKYAGTYGPFVGKAFPGDVSCEYPARSPKATQRFEVDTDVYEQVDTTPTSFHQKKINYDFVHNFSIKKVDLFGAREDNNFAPYTADTLRLHRKTLYFHSMELGTYAKIVKTVHKKLGNYKDYITGIVGDPITGLSIDYVFELCSDRLAKVRLCSKEATRD